MKFVLYVSEALVDPDSPEEVDIFVTTVSRNPRLGISGHLHREGRLFVQYLEGRDERVDPLVALIRCDRRHRNLTVRGTHRLDRRRFGDWSAVLNPNTRTSYAHWAKLNGVPETLDSAPAARIIAYFRFLERERTTRALPLRP